MKKDVPTRLSAAKKNITQPHTEPNKTSQKNYNKKTTSSQPIYNAKLLPLVFLLGALMGGQLVYAYFLKVKKNKK